MAVTLEAPDQESLQRPDVDIAVVLDRSGSMEGEKLAQAKLAAGHLISGLKTGDQFSITAYGTDVDVIVPTTIATEAAKQKALLAISSIYTDGGTNMSDGIIAARSQLLNMGAQLDRVQRIVLISDGQANEGIIGKGELARLASHSAQRGVSITTVGVGQDFDEQTMTRIAVSGRGNYYYAESASMLSELFSEELGRLGATVATRLQLQITPQEGVVVQEVFGYDMDLRGEQIHVNVADMHAGETRKVVVALKINTPETGSMSLAQINASFVETGSQTLSHLTTSLGAEVTLDPRAVEKGRDMISNRLIERALTAQAIEDATQLYEQGRRAEADKLIDGRVQQSLSVASELDDAEFAEEMTEAQNLVKQNFAAAPAMSSGGKRARKKNRKAAYDMMH